MALRARPLGQFGGIGAVGRERQRHCGRQLHDGVGGLGRADAEPADDDGNDRHLRSFGAVGFGGVDRERLQPVGDHRDHAVARFFEQALIDPGHHGGGGVGLGFVSGAVAADHHVVVRAARAVDDGDGLLLGGRGLLGRGFRDRLGSARGRRGGFFACLRRLPDGDADDRLAAQRIVIEDGKADESHKEQAEQHRNRLRRRKRQPKSALSSHRLLSKRRAQIVGRLCHAPPRINRADDTTTGQGSGSSTAASALPKYFSGLPPERS